MNRRDIFKAAPAAAGSLAETPIVALFREWQKLTASCEGTPDLSDDELDRISDARIEIENQMVDMKPENSLDALLTLMAFTDFGGYDQLPSREYHPELWAGCRELVEGVISG